MRFTLLLVAWFIVTMTVHFLLLDPSEVANLLLVGYSASWHGIGTPPWFRVIKHLWLGFYLEFSVFMSVPIYFTNYHRKRDSRNDEPRRVAHRWYMILLITWIAVTVFVVLVFCIPYHVCHSWFMDTSQATVQKIQPGMTIAEVERIIGGPPGSYVFAQAVKFRKVGSATPNEISWTTRDGTITVGDGASLTNGGGWLKKPNGIVDWAKWEPLEGGSIWDNPGSWIGVVAVLVLVGVLWGFVVWLDRVAPLPPPTTTGEQLRNIDEKG